MEAANYDENFPGVIDLSYGNTIIATLKAPVLPNRPQNGKNPVVTCWSQGNYKPIFIEFVMIVA